MGTCPIMKNDEQLARGRVMEESTSIAEPARKQISMERGEILEPGSKTEKAFGAIKCVYCDDDMVRGELSRYNRVFAIAILVIGVLLSVFAMLLLGLPMVVIGAYMTVTSRSVWMCRACGVVVDRHGA